MAIIFLLLSVVSVSSASTNCKLVVENNEQQAHLKQLLDLFGQTFEKSFKRGERTFCYKLGICVNVISESLDAAAVEYEGECGSGVHHVLGKYLKTSFIGSEYTNILKYEDGDELEKCRNLSATTQVILSCSKKDTVFSVLSPSTYSSNECLYIFELASPHLCSKSSSLSTGSVLVILFFVGVLLYLAVGVFYLRYSKHQTGLSQIPHFAMWKNLGAYAADGCDFCCRCGTVPRSGYDFDVSRDDGMIQP